jgi:hypothetical protein
VELSTGRIACTSVQKKKISFAADLFEVFAEQREVEWRPIRIRLPIDQNDDEKIQRASKMHSLVVSEHLGG